MGGWTRVSKIPVDYLIVNIFFQISDKRLKQFKENVGASSRADSVKKFKQQDGSDVVKDELDHLNKLYMEMVDWANKRLKQITLDMSSHGGMQVRFCLLFSDMFLFVV